MKTQKNRKSGKHKTRKQFLYNPNNPKKSFDVYIDKDPDKITFDEESPKVEELPSDDTCASESLITVVIA